MKLKTAAMAVALAAAPLVGAVAQDDEMTRKIAEISQGDYFISTTMLNADGLVEGDNVILQISREVLTRDFRQVLIPVGNRIGCNVGKVRPDGRYNAKCDRIILQSGHSIPFNAYLAQQDGSRGLTQDSLKKGTILTVIPVSIYAE